MRKALLAGIVALMAFRALAGVEINQASEADLDGIKGIGPSLSRKILAERKKGDFSDWHELLKRVSGIGEKSALRLSEAGLTVGGLPYTTKVPDKQALPSAPR